MLNVMDRSTVYFRLSLVWLALLLVTSLALVVLLLGGVLIKTSEASPQTDEACILSLT